MKVCIDAGHYGKYNQSPVNRGYWESEFTWKFHLILKSELEKHGIDVVTTRADQATDLDVYKRGQLAKGCDLFLSIHSNACGTESVDYPLACCTVNGTADVLGHELAEIVGNVMQTSGKPCITKKKQSDGRDWYGVLRGAASVGVPGILLEHSFHTNLRATEWLLNEDNLRRMAAAEAEVIAAHFDVTSDPSEESNARRIWDKFLAAGLTGAGAAGLMGNLKAESDLEPQNVQNSFERKIGYDDRGYTEAVDFGSYTNFANDGAGYGLAQWTYPARKAALLTFTKARQKSVGDLDVQLDFLVKELRESYPALFRQLCTTDDVRAASDAVLTQFEHPADMSESVKQKRAGFAEAFLREFGGQEDAVADALQGVLEIGGKRYEVTLIEA